MWKIKSIRFLMNIIFLLTCLKSNVSTETIQLVCLNQITGFYMSQSMLEMSKWVKFSLIFYSKNLVKRTFKILCIFVMYKCNYLKIKIPVNRKHLAFCDSYLTHSFVRVKVCQIWVNFKCNQSTWNLKCFSFFKRTVSKLCKNFIYHKLKS